MSDLLRTDHVGSLQRPNALVELRTKWQLGDAPADELRALEDEVIADAIALQQGCGISVVTDGEFRRFHYGSHVTTSIDGYQPQSFGVIERKLVKRQRFFAPEDVALTKRLAGDTQWKLTAPTPALVRPEMMRKLNPAFQQQELPPDYSSWDEVQADMVAFYVDELEQLADEGCTYFQFDKVILPFVDPVHIAEIEEQGKDPAQELAAEIAWENRAYDVARARGITTAMHMCRGNRGRTEADFGRGGYDAAAEQLFGDLHVDRLLLEYDTERAGGFEPLRFVPKDVTVVLGLVSTKSTELEDQDTLLRRIDEASQFLDPAQMALGPQCGFSSAALPEQADVMTIEIERSKLELISDTARRAWG